MLVVDSVFVDIVAVVGEEEGGMLAEVLASVFLAKKMFSFSCWKYFYAVVCA